ncbi:MAG TPA: HlyD family efflux transporter periplasmic adaptor subunit [Alphaproteobacteria bacterium]|jgi:hypothetical protein
MQTSPPTEPAERNQTLERLATLLLLQQKARAAASAVELSYLAVNETALLVNTTVGLEFTRGVGGGLRLHGVSGLPSPSPDAAFTGFANRCAAHFAPLGKTPQRVSASGLPETLRQDWGDYLPPEAIWLPLPGRRTPLVGGLLLLRDAPWQVGEERLLVHWAETLGHAYEHLSSGRARWHVPLNPRRKLLLGGGALALLLLGAMPVSLYALANAEVAPKAPIVVRSPLSGVVETLLVEPNDQVKSGQPLVKFDLTELNGRLDVARQTYEIAAAELRQAQQQTIQNVQLQTAIPVLRARLEQRRAEIAYDESLLQRANVTAQQDGVVILPDATAWQGRPVKIGERIMLLANSSAAELELWIPVADALELTEGAEVTLFLNNDPEQAVPARLRYANYQAVPGPDGIVAFRAVADFTAAAPRLGLRGTAKVRGPRVPLVYALIRRPWAAFRQWAGM